MANRFKAVGKLVFPKADAKRPFVKEVTNKDKNKTLSMNLGIRAGDNNVVYTEMYGVENQTIKAFGTDGAQLEIAWENRNDEDVLSSVGFGSKIIVQLDDDNRKEFLSQYDAIKYIKENINEYKDNTFMVTGKYDRRPYNGEYYDHFSISGIYAVMGETKNKITISLDYFWNVNSIDKSDWKSEKIMYLDGYINQYINKDVKNKYIPLRLIFNASKLDPNNETHMKLLNYKLSHIETKAKTMQKLCFEINYFNGAAEIEFDESMLTKAQKQQVELGLKELKDFKPAGSTYGNKITEYRIYDFTLKDMGKSADYSDGAIDTEMKESEFEDEIFVNEKKEETVDDMMNSKKEETKITVDDDDDDDLDLFG